MFKLHKGPRSGVFLAGVPAGDVEESLIRIGPGDEVPASGERLDLVDNLLHEVVEGFNVGLEAMLAGREGAVHLTRYSLDDRGQGRVVLGLPAPHELAAVVGWPGDAVEVMAADLQMPDHPLGQDRSLRETQLVGVAQEEQAGGNVAGGAWQIQARCEEKARR